MRIICPACAAEYEVDDSAIPPEGRDVQCSNCGRAWFQLPSGPLDGEDEAYPVAGAAAGGFDAGPALPPVARPMPQPVAAPSPESDVSDLPPLSAGGADTADARAAPSPEARSEAAPEAGQSLPRPSLDAALREVLRAEAAREAAARQAESVRIETQSELGLTVPPRPAPLPEAPRAGPAVARLPDAAPAPAVPQPKPPRKRLPAIEDVDPVLAPRPAEPAAPPPGAESAEARRGFRLGFLLVLVIALALVMLYLFGRMRPEPGPVLSAYVAWVDEVRLMLSMRLEALVRRLTEMMTGGG
jgi:predicted Zn finger-like uncharacterized protein